MVFQTLSFILTAFTASKISAFKGGGFELDNPINFEASLGT